MVRRAPIGLAIAAANRLVGLSGDRQYDAHARGLPVTPGADYFPGFGAPPADRPLLVVGERRPDPLLSPANGLGRGEGRARHVPPAALAGRVIELAKAETISALTPSAVQAAIGQVQKSGRSLQTCTHHLRAIKQFSAWLVRDGRAVSDPWLICGVSTQPWTADMRGGL